MTGQQLRNSILQEAIQGRLVPNVLQPGEKTGAELLQDILAERQKKENEEKGKKARKLTLSTIEEEPWELPEGWCWCCGKDIFYPMESIKPTSDFVYIDTDAVNNKKNIIDNPKNVLLKDAPSRATRKLHRDDILFSMVRPYLKNIAYVDENFASAIGTTGFYVITTSPLIYRPYLFKLLLSDYVVSGLTEYMKGDNSPSINNGHIENFLYPIPPVSIQKKITAKIEELLPLVDEYDKAAGELKALNETLPDKFRKSVLQEAIHGNLVPNDIPEGEATAPELLQQILKERQDRENKEKGKKAKKLTLSPIEEEPWELPEGWCWCQVCDLCEVKGGKRIPAGRKLADEDTGYKYIRVSDMKRGSVETSDLKYVPIDIVNSIKRYTISKDDIYITVAGTIGEVGTIPAELDGANLTENADKLVFGIIKKEWLFWFLSAPFIKKQIKDATTKVGQPKLAINKIEELLIPLPPLSIQHRIVEKIEELFSAINTL